MSTQKPRIGVGMVGYAFMGAAHSQAWRTAGHAFDLPYAVDLIGYEHTFTHEVVDLPADIAAGKDPVPSFADGLQVQQVLAAVEASVAADSRWTAVESSEPAETVTRS